MIKMHKTLYIDADEEITSIIDKIHKESSREILLVVPKGAILTQGVINLKLLKKETERIGKDISIIANDNQVKKVIARLGMKNQDSSGGDFKKNSGDDLFSIKATDEVMNSIKSSENTQVGSDNFFDNDSRSDDMKETREESKKGESLIRRDNTIVLGSAERDNENLKNINNDIIDNNTKKGLDLKKELYKKRNTDIVLKKTPSESSLMQSKYKDSSLFNSNDKDEDIRNEVINDKKKRKINGEQIDPGFNISEDDSIIERAEKFFGSIKKDSRNKENEIDSREVKSRRWGLVLIPVFCAFISLLVFGVWVYMNYPKVRVTVFPTHEKLNEEIKIVASSDIKEVFIGDDKNDIRGDYIELAIKKTMEFKSTGEAFESDDGKARGKVEISNEYSTVSQPLVATTRLLSKEGKLFRTTERVVVPGMKNGSPGVVEVEVVADKPGEDYNIDPSTFKVEGFKSKPQKYSKFVVISKDSMENGGVPDPKKKLSMVTSEDLRKARIKTIEELEKSLEESIASKIGEGKRVILGSIEKEIDSVSASEKEGAIAEKFNYSVVQKVKAVTFYQEDVEKVVKEVFNRKAKDNFEVDAPGQISFKKGVADFEKNTLVTYIVAEAVSWPILDLDKTKEGVLGKKQGELSDFLSSYPEIKKVELTFNPSWITTIPSNKDKISIEEKRQR